ncbi:MAG: 6-hydroxymethylpterin diphosphokinase MptE-like protein, partial [Acidobacteriota bacterium]
MSSRSEVKYRLGSPEFYAALDRRTSRLKLPLWGRLARANLAGWKRGAALRPYHVLSPAFEERPAMVLGYGPSFHEHLDRLAAFRERGFLLIATDRALPHLWGRGFLPDAVVALDSSPQLRAFLEGTPRLYLDALEAAGRVRRLGEEY